MRVLRHEVPVDDKEHKIRVGLRVVAVHCRWLSVVEFWSVQRGDDLVEQTFLVVGTGQQVEGQWAYVGTAVPPGDALAWHLLRR